jgi:hypothetical protein
VALEAAASVDSTNVGIVRPRIGWKVSRGWCAVVLKYVNDGQVFFNKLSLAQVKTSINVLPKSPASLILAALLFFVAHPTPRVSSQQALLFEKELSQFPCVGNLRPPRWLREC